MNKNILTFYYNNEQKYIKINKRYQKTGKCEFNCNYLNSTIHVYCLFHL